MALQCLVQLLILPSVVPQYAGMETHHDILEIIWEGTPPHHWNTKLPEIPEIFGYVNIPHDEEFSMATDEEDHHGGAMEDHHHGAMEDHHGAMEEHHHGAMEEHHHGAMEEHHHGAMEDHHHGVMEEDHHGAMEEDHHGVMEEDHQGAREADHHEDREEGHEASAQGPQWEHTGRLGPAFWGSINHNCLGFRQSPINIDNTIVVRENTMGRGVEFCNYEQVNAKTTLLENNGHTVELKVVKPPAQPRMTGGHLQSNYSMAQLHFHWAPNDIIGSEHTVDSMAFPLEMHLVHLASDIARDQMGGLAVAGFVFKISMEDNPEMESIIERIPSIVHEHQETHLHDCHFDVMKLIQASQSGPYYSYEGSLTTPGCDEVVQWVLYSNPLSISSRQLAVFRTILDHNGNPLLQNFRPVQPLNGRTVVLHTPTPGRSH